MKYLFLIATVIFLASATTYFSENFGAGWEDRWIASDWRDDGGKWVVGQGLYGGAEGLKTSQDARFYSISAKFSEFSNEGKNLILQFSISHSQNIDCGGGYVKLLPPGFDQKSFSGDTAYNIMFGPDICGSTKRTHVIFAHEGQNHLVKREVRCESDVFTHVYTLIVKPDNTYVVKIDGAEKQTGSLEDDWDILPPKKIKDPSQSKPSDWVDDKKIPDASDVKPSDWDDQPAEIADPQASKPEDWDDDLDGDWSSSVPTIPNPEYKGEWRQKMIDNPEYKGEWVHPEIDNPDFKPNPNLYKYNFGGIGIEIWQVKSGTIFDNFLVTDSESDAEAATTSILAQQAEEKDAKKKKDDEEAAKREAEREARAAEEAEGHAHDHDEEVLEVHEPEHVKEDL
jgi:calreticulin